jgi:hypothetical protein
MFNSSINKFPLKIIRKKKTALTPGRAALARAVKWEGGGTPKLLWYNCDLPAPGDWKNPF